MQNLIHSIFCFVCRSDAAGLDRRGLAAQEQQEAPVRGGQQVRIRDPRNHDGTGRWSMYVCIN